jgi:hypothetical protein
MNVDENLPFFFSGMRLSEAKWLIEESSYLEKNYGV